jgi:hypothetical protein
MIISGQQTTLFNQIRKNFVIKFSEKKVKQLNVMTHSWERFSWIAGWIMTLFGFEYYLFISRVKSVVSPRVKNGDCTPRTLP